MAGDMANTRERGDFTRGDFYWRWELMEVEDIMEC